MYRTAYQACLMAVSKELCRPFKMLRGRPSRVRSVIRMAQIHEAQFTPMALTVRHKANDGFRMQSESGSVNFVHHRPSSKTASADLRICSTAAAAGRAAASASATLMVGTNSGLASPKRKPPFASSAISRLCLTTTSPTTTTNLQLLDIPQTWRLARTRDCPRARRA